jgi:hypothetical protein
MPAWKIRLAAVASAVVLLGATASVSAAEAQPNVPSHSQGSKITNLPKSIQAVVSRAKTQVAVTNNNLLLNSDILLVVVGHNGAYENLAAEGHLSLHKKGSGYTGTFVDDFHGAHTYPASATGVSTTAETAKVRIHSGNGIFTFSYVAGASGAQTKAPSKYSSGAFVLPAVASPHLYTTNAPLFALFAGTQFGVYHRPIEGDLTLTTDAVGFVVPHIVHLSHSAYKYDVFPHSNTHVSAITTWGMYIPGDGANGGLLNFSVRANSVNYSVAAQEDDSNTSLGAHNTIAGTAYSGSGNSYSSGQFQAALQSALLP